MLDGKRCGSKPHRGFTMTEVLVACGILTVILSLMTSMAYRNHRVWTQLHDRQIAQDELFAIGIQIQRTAAGDGSDWSEITLSSHAQSRLEQAELSTRRIRDEAGDRIEISLDWKRIGDPPPIRYLVWVDPVPANAEEPTDTRNRDDDPGERTGADDNEASQTP